MRTLSRYWLARFLGLFALVLVTGAFVLFAVELLIGFGRSAGQAAADPSNPVDPLLLAALRVPSAYATYLVPISVYLAAFVCTTLAARWLELVAAESSGLPLARLVAPLLGGALAIAFVFAIYQETLAVRATRALEQLAGGGTRLHYQGGSLWVQRGPVLYSVDAAHPEQGLLEGVRVLERDPSGHLRRLIRAREVDIRDPERWEFRDALVRSYDPTRRTRLPRVESAERVVLSVGGERDLELLAARFTSLSLSELRETIDIKREAGTRVHRALAALHGRLADVGGIFALAVVGFGLGALAIPSRGYGRPASLAVVLLVVYYGLRGAGETLARAELVPPVAATWGVVLLVLALGIPLLIRRGSWPRLPGR